MQSDIPRMAASILVIYALSRCFLSLLHCLGIRDSSRGGGARRVPKRMVQRDNAATASASAAMKLPFGQEFLNDEYADLAAANESRVSVDHPLARHDMGSTDLYSLSLFDRNPGMYEVYQRCMETHGPGCADDGAGAAAFESLESVVKHQLAVESVVAYPSRYLLWFHILHTLVTCRGDEGGRLHIVYDQSCWSPIVSLVKRFSRQNSTAFKNNDVASLSCLLMKTRDAHSDEPIVVIVESLYGNTAGSICPIRQVCGEAAKQGATLLVDDTHAFGALGESGMGVFGQIPEGDALRRCISYVVIGMESACMASQGALCVSSAYLSGIHRMRAPAASRGSAYHAACAEYNLGQFVDTMEEKRQALAESVEYVHERLERYRRWIHGTDESHVAVIDCREREPLSAYDIQEMLVDECNVFVVAQTPEILRLTIHWDTKDVLENNEGLWERMCNILFPTTGNE